MICVSINQNGKWFLHDTVPKLVPTGNNLGSSSIILVLRDVMNMHYAGDSI